MDNIKVMFEGNNLLIFLIVLIAMMGLFVLVGNVIKTFREIKRPKDQSREDLKAQFTGLKKQVDRIEDVVGSHSAEIDDIRHTNRIQCQAVRALLNHAIHDGNTEEMQRAAGALDDYLTEKI
jgi:hypothetical protein